MEWGNGKMNRFLICLISLLLILACNCGPRESNAKDNAILAQVLEQHCKGHLFTVVDTLTITEIMDFTPMPEKFTAEGYDLVPLVEKLVQKNKKPVRLTLKSSPENGYVMADNKNFSKIVSRISHISILLHGLPAFYLEAGVSLPVYDDEEGIVLVYAHRGGFLSSRGWLIAYRLEDGKLREIDRLMLWIS
jgi:hypothetical protein